MKRSEYRAGPWPGLTPRGAGIILACAAFLAIGQALVGPPTRPLPDLPLVAATALLALAIGIRIVRMPGVGSAIAGAYLLPAATLSLLVPSVPQPPLLLIPAVVFDLALWLRASDLRRTRRRPLARELTPVRAIVAGALFGLALTLTEPAFRVFLGDDPSTWSGPTVWLAVAITTVVCGGVATVLSARDRAS